jgi:hypothetical protein
MLLREISFAAVRSAPPVNDWDCGFRISGVRRMEIRGIEIILAGNSNQCEKRIPPRVSESRPHALGAGHLFE